ncbi:MULTISPECIES: CbbQ/NirQ/NorQ/GpvN family protein [unclassified Acidovorax]|jgi:nitric oxide reductase NorQ protein|uniref:CbbQ/NirQ/NorQ/GpvN family protein n=1 Tax=unclassified Acidovorax TaxID=2684926 RepID=UPI0011528E92|nr:MULTISPECIES: CbbQ/NirQ/NorQ/GpvN family protein [unclassified Acidovorax]MBV7459766.1 CbbQ/NirQ/NorQ/GpvN family protein [Acidovorax sp. sif0632]MBV7464791.1 CbbQ/NirQ/NorQ/GpvN family protein [Acidovorax sp. sif0613]
MDHSELHRIAAAALPFYAEQGGEAALFEHAWRQRLPLLIKGPTGCGKTRFVEHMAARLGRPLITVSCHDDLAAADLVGRHLLGAEGTVWADGPLARAVRQGAICYLDEVVEARKDTTVVLHPLADDRRVLPIERTGEQLAAPPEFMLVISYNPGYQSLLKSLKPSTRQRFIALTLGYPAPAVEEAILRTEAGASPQLATTLVRLGTALRQLTDQDLEETASTRLLVMAARLAVSGVPLRAACHAAIVDALTDDADTAVALGEVVQALLG